VLVWLRRHALLCRKDRIEEAGSDRSGPPLDARPWSVRGLEDLLVVYRIRGTSERFRPITRTPVASGGRGIGTGDRPPVAPRRLLALHRTLDTGATWLHSVAMATIRESQGPMPGRQDRRARRRDETIEEALDHAEQIMAERGAGGLTVTEVARRMGIRSPSLYKYFASLHAIYDALFARGIARLDAALQEAIAPTSAWPVRLRISVRAVVGWCVENPALAQLLFWRPVPGFEPSTQTFDASVRQMQEVRAQFADAVRDGGLHPDADSDEAVRLLTVLISGLITQQMANQPGAELDTGLFTSLTDRAVEMFLTYYNPIGQTHADP
jgi:AcrR family transcriptional regulator